MGLSVNKIRKKCDGTDLSNVAKKLIKSWKKLVPSTGNYINSALFKAQCSGGYFIAMQEERKAGFPRPTYHS